MKKQETTQSVKYRLDVSADIDGMRSERERLSTYMHDKRAQNVERMHARGLVPFYHGDVRHGDREAMKQWSAEAAQLIRQTYGDGYPLPNKHARHNFQSVQDGSLRPYGAYVKDSYGVMTPVASSALVFSENGFAELGRNVAHPDFKDFCATAASHERITDWMGNVNGLLEEVHTLTTSNRASQAHGEVPSSAIIQHLIYGQLKMSAVGLMPMYRVGELETFLEARLPRNRVEWQMTNQGRTVYTPEGDHTTTIRAFLRHQFPENDEVIRVDTGVRPTEQQASAVAYNHGDLTPYIYTDLRVNGPSYKQTVSNATSDALRSGSPSVIAKINAEDPVNVQAQRELFAQGFVFSGIEPAQDVLYVDRSTRDVRRYRQPVYLYMSRLTGVVRQVPAEINPDPLRPIHNNELASVLREIDERHQRSYDLQRTL